MVADIPGTDRQVASFENAVPTTATGMLAWFDEFTSQLPSGYVLSASAPMPEIADLEDTRLPAANAAVKFLASDADRTGTRVCVSCTIDNGADSNEPGERFAYWYLRLEGPAGFSVLAGGDRRSFELGGFADQPDLHAKVIAAIPATGLSVESWVTTLTGALPRGVRLAAFGDAETLSDLPEAHPRYPIHAAIEKFGWPGRTASSMPIEAVGTFIGY